MSQNSNASDSSDGQSQDQANLDPQDYPQRINELFLWFANRLVRRTDRITDIFRRGEIDADQHRERLFATNEQTQQSFNRRRARIDARFGRDDAVVPSFDEWLGRLRLDGDNEGAFGDLWSNSTEEPGPAPDVGVPYATLTTLPVELLINIVENLPARDSLRLGFTIPDRFLQEEEGGLNVIRNDALTIERGQVADGEHAMLVHAIIEGYSVAEIEMILDIYDEVIGNNSVNFQVANSPPYLLAAIRVSRPEVVAFLLDRGADITFGVAPDDTAEREAFLSLAWRADRAGAPWGHNSLIDRARELVVLFTVLSFDSIEEWADNVLANYMIRTIVDYLSVDGPIWSAVYMQVVNAIMSRDPSNVTRQRLLAAMPELLRHLVSCSLSNPTHFTPMVPGTRNHQARVRDVRSVHEALRFFIIHHGIPVELEFIVMTGAINPEAAIVMIQSIETRERTNVIYYRVIDRVAATGYGTHWVNNGFLEFITTDVSTTRSSFVFPLVASVGSKHSSMRIPLETCFLTELFYFEKQLLTPVIIAASRGAAIGCNGSTVALRRH